MRDSSSIPDPHSPEHTAATRRWGHRVGAAILASAALLWLSHRANATPILSIDFQSSPATSSRDTGAAAAVTFTFGENDEGSFVDVLLANTTPPSLGSRLTALGFEVPAGLTGPVFATGGGGSFFDTIDYDVSVKPKSLDADGGYDVMLTSEGKFQGGSPRQAPSAGESETVRLALGQTGYGADGLRNLFMNHFSQGAGPMAIVYFQSVGQQGAASDTVIGSLRSVSVVPEAQCIWLLLAGAAVLRRRRLPAG